MDYYQTVTLLAAIITIITGILAIDEQMSKDKLVRFIVLILSYSLPIFFIQQVVEFTYLYKNIILCLFPIYLYLKLIELYSTYYGEIKNDGEKIFEKIIANHKNSMLMVVLIVISLFLYLFENYSQDFFIENFTNDRKSFFIDLMQYHICWDMVDYLNKNLFITLCIIMDTANLFFIYLSIKHMIGYTYRKMNWIERLEHFTESENKDNDYCEYIQKLNKQINYHKNKTYILCFITISISSRFALRICEYLNIFLSFFNTSIIG